MRRLHISVLFFAVLFFTRTARAQVIDTPIVHDIRPGLINGRVINIKLQNINGVVITDTRTKTKANSNNLGFYQLEVAVGDTLFFDYPGLSQEIRKVKNFKNKLNVILIKRKINNLPEHALKADSVKAKKADDELYRILEKDAKLEGKWEY